MEAEELEKEIKFTEKHIEQIKEDSKWTTLRTIKKENLYPEYSYIKIKETDIKIMIFLRRVLLIKEGGFELFENRIRRPETLEMTEGKSKLANSEGFNSYGKLIRWFKKRNYNIPQPMFLYYFRLEEVKEEDEKDS